MGKKARLKALRQEVAQKKIEKKRAELKKILTVIALSVTALAILFLASTVLKPGLPSGHDISAHAIRSRLFIDALNDGQFPVRWTEWTKNGFNRPTFNFYPVGFYYLVALVNKVVPSLTESIKITVVLLWWAGAGLMFLYARRFGNLAGALAALVYAFTPYIILDIFVRAAYPELAAITFSVGVLWALDRLLIFGKPIYGLPLAIFSAAMMTSHPFTLLILLPLFLAYSTLLAITRQITKKGVVLTLISSLLGVGLASFYLLPSFFELNLIKNAAITSQYYDFHQHFVYFGQLFSTFWDYGISVDGPGDSMPFQLGLVQWLLIGIALSVWVAKKFYKQALPTGPYLIFWLVTALYAIFFTMKISVSFWENFPGLSYIQYPWRFLMIAAFVGSGLAAVLFTLIKQKHFQIPTIFLGVIIIFLLYRSYLTPAVFLPNDYFNIDSPNWRQSQGISQLSLQEEEGDLPQGIDQLPKEEVGRWTIIDGQGKVKEEVIKNHQLAFSIEAEKPIIFRINTHYFPGWKVYVDNQETEINHNDGYGFMNIIIPSGSHQIQATFTNTTIRSLSNIFTIISLLILIIWQLSTLKFFKKRVDSV